MPIASGRGRIIANRQLVNEKTTVVYNEVSEEDDYLTTPSGISIVLGEAVGQGYAGYIGSDGLGYLADASSINTIAEFIYMADGSTGDIIPITNTGEIFYNPVVLYPFTIGEQVYLGGSGELTQTIPTTGVWQNIGVATGEDTVLLQIDEAFIL